VGKKRVKGGIGEQQIRYALGNCTVLHILRNIPSNVLTGLTSQGMVVAFCRRNLRRVPVKGFGFFLALVALVFMTTALSAASPNYVITNDDNQYPAVNSASIYSIGSGGALNLVTTITTGGYGRGGGYYAMGRVNVLRSKTQNCAYIGDALGPNNMRPGDVAAIDMNTLKLTGTYPGSALDSGALWGTGLTENPAGTFLFAAYSTSGTLATYAQDADCKLTYKSEIITIGANVGPVDGMRVTPNGKYLIVAYSDASIGSYSIDPKTGALTLISRYLVTDSGLAAGVDITADGKWALFGTNSLGTGGEVEVAAINANGTLGATVGYIPIGQGNNSSNVWLSPDETYVYISNNYSGQITAVPFDAQTGVINSAAACTSAPLKNYNTTWQNLGNVATRGLTKLGSPLYAAEWSYTNPGGIAIVNILVNRGVCSFSETADSPVADPVSDYLMTVGVDPPRAF
jgi:hypothetical protein